MKIQLQYKNNVTLVPSAYTVLIECLKINQLYVNESKAASVTCVKTG